MAVLTLPTAIRRPASADWQLRANTRTFQSWGDGSVQTLEMSGLAWRASISWQTLALAEFRLLQAFLAQLRGSAGRFYYGPPQASLPRGTVAGVMTVNGASQTGSALVVAGFTGTILTGDFISFDTAVGRELHVVTADLAAPGALQISPPIRFSPASLAVVTYSSPTCVMGLVGDDEGFISYRPGVFGSVTLGLTERYG